jgi:F-type H+-transporting ATPase subunit epsilon
MFLEIVTPESTLFEGEVDAVNVPGAAGAFEVLKNHAPIISALDKGSVIIKSAATPNREIAISGGVIEVLNNRISILTL